MINYFPTVYPDELIYSVLSRVHEKNGYLSTRQGFKEFYNDDIKIISTLFPSHLNDNAKEMLKKNSFTNNILYEHSMLKYFCKFLNGEELNTFILQTANKKDKKLVTQISMKMNRLRFCPICVEEDRYLYGETYWKCIHQIPEINICPKHGCILKDSIVPIKTREFYSADLYAYDYEPSYGTNIQQKLAKYIHQIISLNLPEDFNIRKIIAYELDKEKSYYAILHKKLVHYYKDFEYGVKRKKTIVDIITGECKDTFKIAQLCCFLDINVNALTDQTYKNIKVDVDRIVEEFLQKS